MSRSRLGLDIGTNNVKAVVAEVDGDSVTIVKAASRVLTPGLVLRGSVEKDKIAQLGAEIRTMLDESEITETEVVIGINNTDIFSHSFEIPFMEPDDLKESIITMVESDAISGVSANDSELDYIVINDTGPETGEDRMLTLFLVMPVSQNLENAALAATEAGLDVVAGEVNVLAALRATRITQYDAGPFVDVIVDFGASLTSVLVHQYGVPRYIHVNDQIGGDVVTKTVQSEAEIASFEEAQAAKESGGTEADVVGMTILRSCRTISTAVRKIIDNYLTEIDEANDVRSITMIGGGALLQGLRDTIALDLKVPVEMGFFDENYTSSSGVILAPTLDDGSNTLVAAGLTTAAVEEA